MSYRTLILHEDESTAPPSQPLLAVDVIADVVFLSICTEDGGGDAHDGYTVLAKVAVPLPELRRGLDDGERTQHERALRR